MKSGLGAKLGKKIKISDAMAHSHQFCQAIQEGKLTAEEAVEEFGAKYHYHDAEKIVFIFRDDSFVAQLHANGEIFAYERKHEPTHLEKGGSLLNAALQAKIKASQPMPRGMAH